MQQRLTTLLLVLFCALTSMTATKIGDWETYLSYHNCTQNVIGNDCVYALTNGSLFSYGIDDTQVKGYSKGNGLSDTQITFIRYCKSEGALLIVYKSGNVDLLFDNGEVVNLPQYMNSGVSDKTFNDVVVCGKEAVLSTSSGVVIVNIERQEFSNTYNIDLNVLTAVVCKDYIFAFTTKGIYGGDRRMNLLDISNWEKKSGGIFSESAVYNDKIYTIAGDGFYNISYPSANLNRITSKRFTLVNMSRSPFVLANTSEVFLYDPESGKTEITFANSSKYLSYDNGVYWSSEGEGGLQAYQYDNVSETLLEKGAAIIPNSPIRNYCYFMRFTNDRLLIAGGSLNYSAITYKGTLMAFEKDQWINFDETQIEDTKGLTYNNMTCIIEDPQDPTHHFASAAGTGLYEYKDFKMVNHYDCTNSNLKSILTSNPRAYVRLDGLNYDKDGNLWMTNNQVDTILRVMKPNGEFKGYYFSEIANHPTCEKTIIDSKGRLWMTSRRLTGGNPSGIFCLNYNGTIDDLSDDTHSFKSSIVNQDGISYTPNLIYSIAEDKKGKIWIGTDKRPFVIDDPDEFFYDDFYYTQVKVPRNDGTDYADYLLDNVSITAIAVDAADRKWFGTDISGVFVVSSDGMETLHHFTTENSQLLSDNIYSIAVDETSGKVYIGTSEGVVAYNNDATRSEDVLKKENLKVTPNPIRPNYNGNIVISGFTFDADIKITTVTGKVVAAGTSVGGSFVWDGKNSSGIRVASGVYYVMASTSDGSKGATARIVVIR